MSMETGVPQTSDPDKLGTRRLDAHLAEYNALSTRLTYWINLQYVTYVIAAAALGFVGQGWGHIESRQLAWTSILILLILLWALAQTNFEIFSYVVYIETHLRRCLRPLLQDDSFWKFEHYLRNLRQKRFLSYEKNFGLVPLFACGMGVAAFVIIRGSLRLGRASLIPNLIWLGCGAYVAVMAILKFRQSLNLQAQLTEQNVFTRTRDVINSNVPATERVNLLEQLQALETGLNKSAALDAYHQFVMMAADHVALLLLLPELLEATKQISIWSNPDNRNLKVDEIQVGPANTVEEQPQQRSSS